jgi:hypothetical protein
MSVIVYGDRYAVVDPPSETAVSRREQKQIDKARRALVGLLAEEGHLLPGGIIERMMRCGKANCRCNADPPQLHGPYHQWAYTKASRRYTRRLTDAQLERYGPDIERGRRLMQLLAELDEAELNRVEQAEGWGT